MRAYELSEGKNTPSIVVDVQPEYTGVNDGLELDWIDDLMKFLNNQRGPILMFVNAEDQGMTADTVDDVKLYWEDSGFDPANWSRVTIVDKGYGYFRAWMDANVSSKVIIKTIRLMYQNKVFDSRELFGGHHSYGASDEYKAQMRAAIGDELDEIPLEDGLAVKWTSVAQLKKFSGAYLMGGARNECLEEVKLLMNAFNIRYKQINEFIYD